MSSRRDTVRGVTFPSHAWGIRPITTDHWRAGQSEHASLLRTMSFVKIDPFQKDRAQRSNNNVQYVENNVFLNLKPHKHIAPNTQNNLLFSSVIWPPLTKGLDVFILPWWDRRWQKWPIPRVQSVLRNRRCMTDPESQQEVLRPADSPLRRPRTDAVHHWSKCWPAERVTEWAPKLKHGTSALTVH